MGSNKRYAADVDRRMDARIAERIMRSGPPQSLTVAEQQRGRIPLTEDPEPSRVRAWVRYPGGSLEVDALAIKWTSRAVGVEWGGPDGETHRAWVWMGAVDRI